MKKFFVVVLMVLSSSLFALNYKVKDVRGKVTYEETVGKSNKVELDMDLSGEKMIKVNLNAFVVLTDGITDVKIPAGSSGTVEGLFNKYGRVTVLRTDKKISKSAVADASSGIETIVNTASSRASEAKQDYSWDEE